MSRLFIRLLVVCSAISLIGLVGGGPATADSTVGTCNSGTVVTSTLKVDGVAQVVNASGSTYALTVCRVTSNGYYSVQVGLNDGGVLKEDLSSANLEKVFEVTFTPVAGDTPTVADFYGRVQTYVVGSSVVVSVKPTPLTKVNYSSPSNVSLNCLGKEFTDAACISLAGVDMAATLTGSVRFDTSVRQSNYSKLAGTMVSASANLYDVVLSGPCPLASGSFSGSDGAVNRPSSETTTLTIKMVGPHFKQNGTSLNSGSLEVFIPKETITACFGGSASELANSLGITRTEAGVTADVVKSVGAPTTGLQYTSNIVNGGVQISVSAVTFSDPTYNLLLHKAAAATTTSTVVGVGAKATQLSRKTARSAKSLAAQAKLSVLAGSKVSLKVVASTSRNCKVTGTMIKGLKVGSCKVIVTVKPKKGPSRSRTLTLKVV
jgi:hypothetical protein